MINVVNDFADSGGKYIIFDNIGESLNEQEIDKVYEILPKLKIPAKNIYMTTLGYGIENAHQELYKNNSNLINIVSVSIFENIVPRYRYRWPKHYFDREYTVEIKPKKFICYNRMPHVHRACLLALLWEKDLVKNSYYSFYDFLYPYRRELEYNRFDLSQDLTNKVIQILESNKHLLPLRLTLDDQASNPNNLAEEDFHLYDSSYFSVVPETFFFQKGKRLKNTYCFSEKIFKTILMKHPFIVMSEHKYLHYFKELGYKTFSPYIDESYDEIENDEQRMFAIVNEIERLSSMTDAEWLEWQSNIKDIVDHNYKILTEKKNYLNNTINFN